MILPDFDELIIKVSKNLLKLFSGYFVHVLENNATPRSVLFRISDPAFEAEFVFWDNGCTSLSVFDCESGQYVLDKHDLIISSSTPDMVLSLIEASVTRFI